MKSKQSVNIFRTAITGGFLLSIIAIFIANTIVASLAIVFFLFAFLYPLYPIISIHFCNIFKSYQQKNLINSFIIIPYYEPPSEIHPAATGYLID